MLTSCVRPEWCGTQASGWLNGMSPSRESGINSAQACFNFRENCCFYSLPIQVKKCSDFFVYKLKEIHSPFPGQYCFTKDTPGKYKRRGRHVNAQFLKLIEYQFESKYYFLFFLTVASADFVDTLSNVAYISKKIVSATINSHVIAAEDFVESSLQCMQLCTSSVKGEPCLAFDYNNVNQTCQLYNKTTHGNVMKKVQVSDVYRYERSARVPIRLPQ